jgi:hypothetical protein
VTPVSSFVATGTNACRSNARRANRARTVTEYAPDAIEGLFDAIAREFDSAEFSGIVGDQYHTYGYHRGRHYVSSADYSVQLADDQKGSGEAACGLDVSLNDADMATVTRRLIDAVNRNDPRLIGCRSFLGTTDGYTVTGRDCRSGAWITGDPSHLWHEHFSIIRKYADDHDAMQDLASIITGDTAGSDAMPTQYYLKASSAHPTIIDEAGVYEATRWESWDPDGASGGLSCVLPTDVRLFTATAWWRVQGLPEGGNLYTRIQTLDRDGNEKSKFPAAELRATTGDSYLSSSMSGSVGPDTNLRLLVAATHPCTIVAAYWRVLWF